VKPTPITVVGRTTDGKLVVDGIWKCFETYGLPFDVLFEVCLRKGWVPDWRLLHNQMVRSGVDRERALSKLSEAICDTFGKAFCDEVILRFLQFPYIRSVIQTTDS
jgi:alanyl-tRNA synthetase